MDLMGSKRRKRMNVRKRQHHRKDFVKILDNDGRFSLKARPRKVEQFFFCFDVHVCSGKRNPHLRDLTGTGRVG